jgi:hypothetical protein
MTGVSKLNELIEAERQACPEATSVQRGWERLDAAVAAGVPPTPGMEATGMLELSGATSLGKLIGVCAIGGSVAVGGATWAWVELRPGATEYPAPTASAVTGSGPVRRDRGLERPSSQEPAVTEKQQGRNPELPARDDRESRTGSGHSNSRDAESQRESSTSGRPAAPESTFEEELALIKRAKVDLDSGRSAAALRLLNDHAARFPKGVFASEREALRILAQCASGTSASSRSMAERFVRTHPRSPLVDRVSRACGLQKSEIEK